VRVKKEQASPTRKAPKRGFQEIVTVSDDEVEFEEEEQDVGSVPRPATSSSRSVPVVEIPRKTRQSSVTSKKTKKVRVERTPHQEFHETLQTQFQIISEAFQVVSKTMALAVEE
jgi:hypothetical protein